MIQVTAEQFEALVADALDELPEGVAQLIDNVVVVVEDDSPDDLLGLYEGLPLTERSAYGLAAGGTLPLPDRIILYRIPICAMCDDFDDIIDEIMVTVIHEVAHHFGIDDNTLESLGWD